MLVCRSAAAAVLAGTLLFVSPPVGTVLNARGAVENAAQTASGGRMAVAADIDLAKRALNFGHYAEIEQILRGADAGDADRSVLRAAAFAARGNYEQAERILAPAARQHPKSDAALELGLLYRHLGRTREANLLLSPLVAEAGRDARSMLRAGRAAHAIGEYKIANDLLRQSVEQMPDDAAANLAWGQLFLDKHNNDDAKRSFEGALRVDAENVSALVGLAAAQKDEEFGEAVAALRHALQLNPSSVAAQVGMAELLLEAGHVDAARQSLDRALAVNPRSDAAYSLVAAIARLDNRPAEFQMAMDRAMASNNADGEPYRVVAQQLASHYRFDEAADVARKAVAVDPDNSRARTDLGMDLLRIGDEDQARVELKRAFDLDPYDPITYNLLAVLDALKDFKTFRDGDIILRTDPNEASVLKEPFIALAHQALNAMSAKYGFAPRGPILIEVFPHHDDFAVRNLGIPGLERALGACFGRVVTMDSPKARPPGTFQWSATLWHELTHVITLQMSAQRVPRWLTEGISVYEEQSARPEWRRPMEEELVATLNSNKLPSLRDIGGSFSDPSTVAVAYYHAGLVVGFLIEKYGQDKFNSLVRSFSEGVTADAAFTRAFGKNLDAIQADFSGSLDNRFGALRRALAPIAGEKAVGTSGGSSVEEAKALAASHPDSYDAQLALGTALQKQGDYDAARQALTRASTLFPQATGADSPHAILADMALEKGDQAAAIDEMEKRLEFEPTNIELARRIAGLVEQGPNVARVRRVYERIVAIDPFDADAHASLAALAAKSGDPSTAVREYRAALAAGANDEMGVRCSLAEALLLSGDAVQAKRETLAILEQAPTYARAQELLLKLVEVRR